jgi:hypothetical protein
MFITVLTKTSLWFLSWVRLIQPTPSNPIFPRFISILSFRICQGLSSGLFPSGFPIKSLWVLCRDKVELHLRCFEFELVVEKWRLWAESLIGCCVCLQKNRQVFLVGLKCQPYGSSCLLWYMGWDYPRRPLLSLTRTVAMLNRRAGIWIQHWHIVHINIFLNSWG